jgi:hypothetical protein
MVCRACGRTAQDRYCAYHDRALQSLRIHYDIWVRAYGEISWEKFLEKLEKMPETGIWIKDVIKAELKK